MLLGTPYGSPCEKSWGSFDALCTSMWVNAAWALKGTSSPQDPPLGLVPTEKCHCTAVPWCQVSGLVPSFFGSKLHLLREGPEDASNSSGDPQWHLPAGPQPAGWKLKRFICVQVPG